MEFNFSASLPKPTLGVLLFAPRVFEAPLRTKIQERYQKLFDVSFW